MKTNVYQRVTDQIVSSLEEGVRPWMKRWNAEHAAGRITWPLRANGIPYKGSMRWCCGASQPKGTAPDLDDLPAVAGPERPCPQRGARQHGRLCQQNHPHRHRYGDGKGNRTIQFRS